MNNQAPACCENYHSKINCGHLLSVAGLWLSCSHLKKGDPTTASGNYNIDPDGEGSLEPFSLYCDMTNKNGVGVTVTSHDSESRITVDGYEDKGSYSRDINYTGAGLSQLVRLTIVYLHCEQFIKYECHHSGFWYEADPDGWWVSRDSTKMTYWGGASPGSAKCACGINNSCANPNKGCNCDAQHNHLGIIQTNLSVNVIIYCFFSGVSVNTSICSSGSIKKNLTSVMYEFSDSKTIPTHTLSK